MALTISVSVSIVCFLSRCYAKDWIDTMIFVVLMLGLHGVAWFESYLNEVGDSNTPDVSTDKDPPKRESGFIFIR